MRMSTYEKILETKRKWGYVYALALIAITVFIAHFLLMYLETKKDEYLNIIFLLALLGCYIGYSLFKITSLKIPRKSLVRLLKCDKCGYSLEDSNIEDDYIFKTVGKCPKCNGEIYVAAIYIKTSEK